MSGELKVPRDRGDAAPSAARIDAAAEIVDFEPGLYAVDMAETAVARAGRGMLLPCIHVGPLPAKAGAYAATLSSNTLIVPNGSPAYVRAEAPAASLLVTKYWLADVQTAPELRIRPLGMAEEPGPPPGPPGLPSLPLQVSAHIERAGDVAAPGGHWVGRPRSAAIVEGFSITPGGDVRPADIEYQALLGTELSTAWMRGGEFCGSRGMSLPTMGLRVRLIGRAAKRFQCNYGASFVGAGIVGPFSDGEACTAGEMQMEAFWVSLIPRQAR